MAAGEPSFNRESIFDKWKNGKKFEAIVIGFVIFLWIFGLPIVFAIKVLM